MGAPILRRSDFDEHRLLEMVVVGTLVFALAMRSVPRQFDLFHRFQHGIGFMAPTCGLTRAGLALTRLDLASAWSFNPAIFVAAPMIVMVLVRLLIGWAGHRWITLSWRPGPRAWVVIGVLSVALWLNQQAHFERLAA